MQERKWDVVYLLLWHCCGAVACGATAADAVEELTLRLLLDEVVVYTVDMLVGAPL